MQQTPATPAAPQPRTLRPGRGVDWLVQGYELFRQAPGPWIGILLIWLVLSMIVSAVPGLNLAGSFLNPIFTAGMMLGCASLARGEGLRVEHLFAGFRSGRVGPLLMLTVWTLVLAVAGLLVLGLGVVLPLLGRSFDALARLSPEEVVEAIGLTRVLVLVLAILSLSLLLAMALWFAPPLIVFHQVSALQAIKLSIQGCLHNWLPLTIYGVLALVMLLLAMLPLLLGLLVAVPVLVASVYAAYRDIYAA